jgi:hypothetical protein
MWIVKSLFVAFDVLTFLDVAQTVIFIITCSVLPKVWHFEVQDLFSVFCGGYLGCLYISCKLWPPAVFALIFVLQEVEGSLLNHAQYSAKLNCSKLSLI